MSPEVDCLPCLVKSTLRMLEATDADQVDRNIFIEHALEELLEKKDSQTGPKILGDIAKRLLDFTDSHDPFDKLKQRRTTLALSVLSELRRELAKSDDAVSSALSLSTLANNPDVISPDQDRGQLVSRLKHFCRQDNELKAEVRGGLRGKINEAQKIFVIGDNAGELVFDLLLLEQLSNKELFYGVRGEPFLNDATEVEALESGIYRWAKIISSGTPTPGTILPEVGGEFKAAFKTADIVLAKGQENYKTLVNPPRPVYYLFVVQCERMAESLDRDVEELVLERRPGRQEPLPP